ncbi:hypothetical protein HYH03_018224 [Edaphochlamys debaryana]|uniref:Cyclic nucleotide-binding domain-containing protein n=1 Tax=Edaphochlamys debaryana TaxID=47281 RepID=A0A835XGF4_9CHLO|nr:hypothetical protein HYH03_018224 [Edaphochlamys debaryana]|eukprot:KAG2482880.1 hypothetical protein HYH03_018224 [Edaphochlamys debaryana]
MSAGERRAAAAATAATDAVAAQAAQAAQQALLARQAAAAAAQRAEFTYLAGLPPNRRSVAQNNKLAIFLASAPRTQAAGPTAIHSLSTAVQVVEVPRGCTLYRINDPSDGFYVIVDGRMVLYDVKDKEEAETDDGVVERLSRNDSFGEEDLLSGSRRAHRAEAGADASALLVRVPPELYRKHLQHLHQPDFEDKVAFLGQLEVFRSLPEDTLRKLAPCFGQVDLRLKEYLVRQGDRADSMFAIASGQCSVLVDPKYRPEQQGPAESDPKKTMQVCLIGPGNIVGDMTVLANVRKRTASVLCLTDVVAYKIRRATFIRRVPPMQLEALRQVAEAKIKITERRVATGGAGGGYRAAPVLVTLRDRVLAGRDLRHLSTPAGTGPLDLRGSAPGSFSSGVEAILGAGGGGGGGSGSPIGGGGGLFSTGSGKGGSGSPAAAAAAAAAAAGAAEGVPLSAMRVDALAALAAASAATGPPSTSPSLTAVASGVRLGTPTGPTAGAGPAGGAPRKSVSLPAGHTAPGGSAPGGPVSAAAGAAAARSGRGAPRAADLNYTWGLGPGTLMTSLLEPGPSGAHGAPQRPATAAAAVGVRRTQPIDGRDGAAAAGGPHSPRDALAGGHGQAWAEEGGYGGGGGALHPTRHGGGPLTASRGGGNGGGGAAVMAANQAMLRAAEAQANSAPYAPYNAWAAGGAADLQPVPTVTAAGGGGGAFVLTRGAGRLTATGHFGGVGGERLPSAGLGHRSGNGAGYASTGVSAAGGGGAAVFALRPGPLIIGPAAPSQLFHQPSRQRRLGSRPSVDGVNAASASTGDLVTAAAAAAEAEAAAVQGRRSSRSSGSGTEALPELGPGGAGSMGRRNLTAFAAAAASAAAAVAVADDQADDDGAFQTRRQATISASQVPADGVVDLGADVEGTADLDPNTAARQSLGQRQRSMGKARFGRTLVQTNSSVDHLVAEAVLAALDAEAAAVAGAATAEAADGAGAGTATAGDVSARPEAEANRTGPDGDAEEARAPEAAEGSAAVAAEGEAEAGAAGAEAGRAEGGEGPATRPASSGQGAGPEGSSAREGRFSPGPAAAAASMGVEASGLSSQASAAAPDPSTSPRGTSAHRRSPSPQPGASPARLPVWPGPGMPGPSSSPTPHQQLHPHLHPHSATRPGSPGAGPNPGLKPSSGSAPAPSSAGYNSSPSPSRPPSRQPITLQLLLPDTHSVSYSRAGAPGGPSGMQRRASYTNGLGGLRPYVGPYLGSPSHVASHAHVGPFLSITSAGNRSPGAPPGPGSVPRPTTGLAQSWQGTVVGGQGGVYGSAAAAPYGGHVPAPGDARLVYGVEAGSPSGGAGRVRRGFSQSAGLRA